MITGRATMVNPFTHHVEVAREREDIVQRRLLRLHMQVHRRGFFMPMWNLEEIVRRRLMRRLFRTWRRERGG